MWAWCPSSIRQRATACLFLSFYHTERMAQVVEDTKVGGATLTKLLGTSAWYAPGAAVSGLVQAIACDQKKIFSVLRSARRRLRFD